MIKPTKFFYTLCLLESILFSNCNEETPSPDVNNDTEEDNTDIIFQFEVGTTWSKINECNINPSFGVVDSICDGKVDADNFVFRYFRTADSVDIYTTSIHQDWDTTYSRTQHVDEFVNLETLMFSNEVPIDTILVVNENELKFVIFGYRLDSYQKIDWTPSN